MPNMNVPRAGEWFKAGSGVASVEARIRQLEQMVAALETTDEQAVGQVPKQSSFLDVLQNKVKPSPGLDPIGGVNVPNFPFAPATIGAPSPVGQAVQPLSPLGAAGPSMDQRKRALLPHIQQVAQRHGVDPALVTALIQQESGFQPTVTSKAGAQGLMQLMPATAKGLGVTDPADPLQNLDGGVRYLKAQLARFNGNVPMALAAYNAGPNAVAKYDGIPPYKETQHYVRTVLANYLKERNVGA